MRAASWIVMAVVAVATARLFAAEIVVDCSRKVGAFRAVHGVNNGPLDVGGTVDLSEFHRALRIPFTRLHDAHWPNPDVVDMHAVFPDWEADASDPRSYDFRRTDEYVAAILKCGSKVVYRLGESIEHGSDKRRVRPPDAGKFAQVCVNIIRHYNEGWADGHRHDIRYWEIWNEPDNRPAMWTGTDEEFFRLYSRAAKEIKARFPQLKVGGPAVGNVGEMKGGVLQSPPFVKKFLEHCQRDRAPLDFFSWHLYSAEPRDFAERTRGVRGMLERYGFAKTESHLNEWNYLPDNDWTPVLAKGQGEKRERFYERIGGAEGAAFVAAALIHLQDAPLDVGNFYAGDTNPFGLFSRHGVRRKNYHAFKAFAELIEGRGRVAARVEEEGRIAVAAGVDAESSEVCVLIANFDGGEQSIDLRLRALPWEGASRVEVFAVDGERDLARIVDERHGRGDVRVQRRMGAPAVWLVKVREEER